MNIKNNLTNLLQNLPTACKLIAVSKTQPVSSVQEAYDAGQRRFGENKVQELEAKYQALPKDIEWHMIGHLQTNKIKYIAPFVTLIHAVDSLKLLKEIDKQAQKFTRVIDCLLQLHIAEEETKFGFSGEELVAMLATPEFQALRNIRVRGLMGMATFTEDKEVVRREFRSLRSLFEKLKGSALPPSVTMEELSIGMSGDFAIAVEEGSTMVRVGTLIFGTRQ